MRQREGTRSDVDFSSIDRVGAEHARQMTAGARLQLALQMMADGVELQRARLRRANPLDGDSSIEARLRALLLADE